MTSPQGLTFWARAAQQSVNEEEIKAKETTGFGKDYRWHRVRLGIPLQSITIDEMDNVNDWYMIFEGGFGLTSCFG